MLEPPCLVAAALRHHSAHGSTPQDLTGKSPRPIPCRRNRARRSAFEL